MVGLHEICRAFLNTQFQLQLGDKTLKEWSSLVQDAVYTLEGIQSLNRYYYGKHRELPSSLTNKYRVTKYIPRTFLIKSRNMIGMPIIDIIILYCPGGSC